MDGQPVIEPARVGPAIVTAIADKYSASRHPSLSSDLG
jgi:hypothetical protein